MNVLLVDSDEVTANATAFALSTGHNVRSVPTVREAMRAIEESRPDAVVCELMLDRGERGDVLLSWLRGRYPSIRRIVFCGGASPTGFDVDIAHAWVLKPDVRQVLWFLRAGVGLVR